MTSSRCDAIPNDLQVILGTRVLEGIARLSPSSVLWGQPRSDRLSRRRRFPRVDFYGTDELPCGILGHHHRRSEIAFVVDGRLNVGIGTVLYEAREHDWLVFRSSVLHGECCLTTRRPYRLLWFIALNSGVFHLHLTSYSRTGGYRVLLSRDLRDAGADVRASWRSLTVTDWDDLNRARRDLLTLVTFALNRVASDNGTVNMSLHPLVEEVKAILRQNFRESLSVTDLANRVGLSPNYLSSLFAAQEGQTLTDYVRQLRVEEARKLLANPRLLVKEIAFRLGFSDPHHFSRVFRRATGMRPIEFRRKRLAAQSGRQSENRAQSR